MNHQDESGQRRSESGFKPVDHTADVAIRVWAPDMVSFFLEAASGLNSIVCNGSADSSGEPVVLTARGIDFEELLVSWLNELLFQYETTSRRFDCFSEGRITRDADGFVWETMGTGHPIRPEQYHSGSQVKAVTYHDLALGSSESGPIDQVIVFDT
jgi:protein archease